jgi:hypothetical protein
MKYPRTPYLPFSLTIDKGDRIYYDPQLKDFIGTEIVITEKLDGGNCCLSNCRVYARSHSEETKCKTFDLLKNKFNKVRHLVPINYDIYGENCYAIHSIKYNELSDVFFMFSILDRSNDMFKSWDCVIDTAKMLNFSVVPELFRGVVNNYDQLVSLVNSFMNKGSVFGSYDSNREGIVMRVTHEFKFVYFTEYVAKCVRENHVQTDMHWSKNWKKQNIKDVR